MKQINSRFKQTFGTLLMIKILLIGGLVIGGIWAGTAVAQETTPDTPTSSEDIWETDPDPYETAAKVLNMAVDALWEQIDTGKSIADIAQEKNIDPQTIIDAIAQAEIAMIDEWEAAGNIDAADADTWRAEAAQYAAITVNSTYQDPFTVAANIMGIDENALWDELDAGETIADVAQAHNVDLQTIIDAIVQSEQAEVEQLLSAELISDEEAKEWQTEISVYVQEIVTQPFDWEMDDKFFEE